MQQTQGPVLPSDLKSNVKAEKSRRYKHLLQQQCPLMLFMSLAHRHTGSHFGEQVYK